MALNYAPLSQSVSLFVANQFRVCARQTGRPMHRCYSKSLLPWVPLRALPFRSWGNKPILYQQTSPCYWRDTQSFSSSPNTFNPHTSLVRPKHLGNKADSESQILPFMSKTGKKNKVARVKSCHECGMKRPSKNKFKIYRPKIITSTGATPNAYFNNAKLSKQTHSGRAENQSEVSVSQVAKEIVEYFNKVIDHLNTMDKTMRLQKIRNSPWNKKYADSNIPMILPVQEATNAQKTSNVSEISKAKEIKAAGKKTHSKKKKTNNTESHQENINPKGNQFWKENCTLKDSCKDAELLEIRPKVVENMQRRKNQIHSQSAINTTAAMKASNKLKTYTSNDGFILVESISAKIKERDIPQKDQNGIPCNEKGFILVHPEERKSNQSPIHCSGEKGFILVNDKGKPDVGQRKSKEDSRNFVLVNDNPFCNSRNTRTSGNESNTSEVSKFMDVLPRADINVQLCMAENETVRCTSLNSKFEGNAHNKISSLLEKQTIGSSDSKEELKRQRKTVADIQAAFANTELSKSDKGVESLKPDNRDSILGSKLQDTGLQKSQSTGRNTLSEGTPVTRKTIDDSVKSHSGITVQNISAKEDAIKENWVKTEANTTKKEDVMETGDIKKAKKQLQRSTVGSKSAPYLHIGAFGNAMKGSSKLNFEPAQANKKSGQKNVKLANSLVNLTTKDKTTSPINTTLSVTGDVGQKITMDSIKRVKPSTSTISQNRFGFNSYNIRRQKSPAVSVHELTPDLPQKKIDTLPPKVNMALARKNNEPQLFVKPEEMANTMKLGSRLETNMISSAEQNTSGQINPSADSRMDNSSFKGSPASSPKSGLSQSQELEQLYKIHSQEMNKYKNNMMSGQEKNQEAPLKSLSETTVPSSSGKEASPVQSKEVMMLSDVFRQLRHTANMKTPQPSSATSNNLKAVTAKGSSRKNDQLVRAIQEQWSQDFQDKFHNLQPNTVYTRYAENCSTEATQNSNTSAGSKPKKAKKTSAPIERTSKRRSPPAPSMVQVSRKSDHLPTMGMAERLLAASQRPPGTNDMPPKVKDSESSINTCTDATVTQGTADDFPEVDQFEEFVQNSMSEIFNDTKANTTQAGDTAAGTPSNKSTTDILKLPNKEQVDDLRLFEGSNVDGDLYVKTATQPPKTSSCAEPALEKNQLLVSTTEKTRINDSQPDKNTPDTFSVTTPKVLYGEKSASMTNTSLGRRPSGHNLKDASRSARLTGSTINIFSNKDTSLSSSTVTRAGKASKAPRLSRSKMFKSVDGFACLTLVEEPQNTTPKNLKPTLKRSPSRERGEEKRVSFGEISKNDNSKGKNARERFDTPSDKYAGSSVDRFPAEENFSGGNNSKDCDLRNQLAEQRKRAEMDARIKLLNEHSRQIREYEAVLAKYRDIVSKFRDDALRAIRGQGSQKEKSSEV